MKANTMNVEALRVQVRQALEDIKAREISELDVKNLTSICDYLLICSGTSSRHINAIAASVEKKLKEIGHPALGVEGGSGSDWVLIDAGDIVVHVMTPDTRDYYQLEKLWDPQWGQAGQRLREE